MNLSEYQEHQTDILYNQGKYHESHDMFIDLDDMWRGCLTCKTSDSTTNGHARLQEKCMTPAEWAAHKVLHDSSRSKKAMMEAGLTLGQRK